MATWYTILWFTSGEQAREAADTLGLDRRRAQKLPRNYSRDNGHYAEPFEPTSANRASLTPITHRLRLREDLLHAKAEEVGGLERLLDVLGHVDDETYSPTA